MKENDIKNGIKRIIVDGDAKILVNTAHAIAKKMIVKNGEKVIEKKSVSRSQLRNIFGYSKKIEMTMTKGKDEHLMYNKLLLLKPKMAYANGRYNKKDWKGESERPGFLLLIDSLSTAIDLADGEYERMKNFFNFFEAILAYHRAEGGN